jgi:hypothetical protein
LLEGEADLAARIVIAVGVWVELMDEYRPFAGTFFKNAAEPSSPLSPFSPESEPARQAAIALWREVIEGSDARIPKRLRPELPEMLWLWFMAIVLFWVHDRTDDASATRAIVERTAPLIVKVIGLAGLPVVRGMIDDLVGLIGEVKQLAQPAR